MCRAECNTINMRIREAKYNSSGRSLDCYLRVQGLIPVSGQNTVGLLLDSCFILFHKNTLLHSLCFFWCLSVTYLSAKVMLNAFLHQFWLKKLYFWVYRNLGINRKWKIIVQNFYFTLYNYQINWIFSTKLFKSTLFNDLFGLSDHSKYLF